MENEYNDTNIIGKEKKAITYNTYICILCCFCHIIDEAIYGK